jgi:hypothetical protein
LAAGRRTAKAALAGTALTLAARSTSASGATLAPAPGTSASGAAKATALTWGSRSTRTARSTESARPAGCPRATGSARAPAQELSDLLDLVLGQLQFLLDVRHHQDARTSAGTAHHALGAAESASLATRPASEAAGAALATAGRRLLCEGRRQHGGADNRYANCRQSCSVHCFLHAGRGVAPA